MFHNLGKLQENCKLLQPLAQVDFMMYTKYIKRMLDEWRLFF